MTNFAARSLLAGEEHAASGEAPAVASGSGVKARAVPARRSSGKKVDEPPVSDDTRRVAFSLPVSVAERITELAAERGVPRSQVARSIVERGLHMDGTRVLFPGGPDRPDLEHVGDAPSDAGGAPPEIPSAYVDDVEPSAASAPAGGDAGGGAPGGAADTSAAEPVREPAPGSAASSGGVDSPGLGVPLVLAQPRSMFEQPNGLVLALVLLVCCRARGTDRNWTRVDRKMLWSPAASSSQQRARVLTDVKARRFAPPPLRGADGLDAGSAHARPDWLLPTMLTHTPPTCCGRRPVQNDALSGDR